MIRLWMTWVSINSPHGQIKIIGIAVNADENIRTAVSTKHTFMVIR